MDVLRYIEIENFRSIRSVKMRSLEAYMPIVGLNSAGKSNILRALNLFFNGQVDEDGSALDLVTDFSSHAPRGKKKYVSVTVAIALDGDMHVRGQEDFQKKNEIEGEIYIRRTWSLAPDKSAIVDSFAFGSREGDLRAASLDEVPTLQTYIRSVRYVYVPNHARPADLIRAELAPLRSTLIARLRATKAYKESAVGDLLDELGRMGDRMFGDVSTAVKRGLPATSVNANLPADFADLVFTVGVSAVAESGEARPPDFEGSGAQSFMLLHILDLADRTRRAGGFGWVQGSVWAVEEPESFLHAGLRAMFSGDLFNYSNDTRRQIIVTTHQDEFARVARSVWTASKGPDGTAVSQSDAKSALLEATRREITTFRHPLFSFTNQPIVIVEGKYDDIHLREALRTMTLRPRWRLVSPSEMFGDGAGGDALLQYLKYNQLVIDSRPDAAPVIVLRDWEATDAGKYDKVLAGHQYSKCLTADASLSNPKLSESFVGIERYLSTELIKEHVPVKKLGLEHAGPDARFTIKRQDLESVKSKLGADVGAGADPGDFMRGLVEWIDTEVEKVVQSVPASAFL